MAARKLKVYRATAGFYDAYVAAPSQKAAIEAWGADPQIFARGNAEVVTDPALTEEPLARPGVVVRRNRGTVSDQLAALGRERPRKRTAREAKKPQPAPKKVAPKPPPPPPRRPR